MWPCFLCKLGCLNILITPGSAILLMQKVSSCYICILKHLFVCSISVANRNILPNNYILSNSAGNCRGAKRNQKNFLISELQWLLWDVLYKEHLKVIEAALSEKQFHLFDYNKRQFEIYTSGSVTKTYPNYFNVFSAST